MLLENAQLSVRVFKTSSDILSHFDLDSHVALVITTSSVNTHTHTDTHTDRQTDRQTDTHTYTEQSCLFEMTEL